MEYSTDFITWLGGKKSCYWLGYENYDYIFYNQVKYFNTQFEVGSGVYVPGINEHSKRDVARIHCFYENPKATNKTERYRAIIEVFAYPESLGKLENCATVNFIEDIDIVQMANPKCYNISIEKFHGRCNVIFALASEDPELIMHQYIKKCEHPVYVCRYIVDTIDNKQTFKCAVSNKILFKSPNLNIDNKISDINTRTTNYESVDSEDDITEELKNSENKKVKNYRVTSLECEKDSVKLRLKRQSLTMPDNIKNCEMEESIVLLERLNIQDIENLVTSRQPLKNRSLNEENTPSPSRRSSRPKTPVDYKQFLNPGLSFTKTLTPDVATELSTLKENQEARKVINNVELVSKNSRRKQNFNRIMYNSQEIELEVKKEQISNTPTKISKRRTSNVERTSTINIRTPVKTNSPIKKREKSPELKNKKPTIVYERRTTKVIIIDSDDESVNSVKEKSLILNDDTLKHIEIDCPIVDTISSKMQAKLGIVTPQKKTIDRPTPQRRRLAKLDEESDEEPQSKTLRKNRSDKNIIKELPTRKSTRISLRNTPRKLLIDSDEDIIKTPKKISETPSKRATPLHKKIASIREEYATPKKETPKRKKLDDNYLESPPKKNASTPKKGTPSRIKITSLSAQIESRADEFAPTDNPFELARAQLHATLKPGCLPCREKEFDDITQFINGKLTDNSGGCMYISGVPGTGKTATVCEIMKVLNDGLKKKVLPNFKFISVNALSLTEPRQVYVEIVKQMVNKTMHWDEALTYIRSFFLKQKHAVHVLLIDELDKLCTRKQDVIYNLLDLPSQSKTPLVVITIANTMDLPERLLSNKVNSRLGLTRLTFRPYKHKELIDIVKARLSAYSSVFRSEALEFVARKVAAVSGDARRALAICSRATEIAEASKEKEITMDIVNKTLTDMISSPKVQAIKSCSQAEKMILQAIVHEVSRTGNDEVSFSSIVQIIEGLCILESVTIPNINMLLTCCHKLHFFRLIIMQEGRYDVANTLLLNTSPDDIHFALKEK